MEGRMMETGDLEPDTGLLGRLVVGWALFGGAVLAGIAAVNVWGVAAGIMGGAFPGAFELTEIGVAVAAFTFLPYCQMSGQNVTADIFTFRSGARLNSILAALGAAVAFGFAALLLWRMTLGMLDQKGYALTSTILQVPIWWAFLPILVSLVLLLASAAASLRSAVRSFRAQGD